ncbi:MAG: hypothetical protein AB1716_20345 [Planctomycetota bacterium]
MVRSNGTFVIWTSLSAVGFSAVVIAAFATKFWQRAEAVQDPTRACSGPAATNATGRPLEDRIVDEYTRLPPELQAVMKLFRGKSAAEVKETFPVDFPGHPVRDVGSGRSILKCDFDEGVLTAPVPGVPEFQLKSGEVIWLVHTSSILANNVIGGFEMTTAPDQANRGTRYWLGNLELYSDGRYAFKESGANPKQRAAQKENFFLDHPAGTFEVAYLWGLGPNTMLEVIARRTTVAALAFKSQDGEAQQEFLIGTDPDARRLFFAGPHVRGFVMDKGWESE